MFNRLKQITPFAILIHLLSFLAFSQIAHATDMTFERITKEGVLIVGMSGEQPPFNFVSKNDKVIGYDMDLAATIGKSLGVKVRIELMPFSTLMDALQKREIDIIISGFASTEARSKQVTFVGPYALSGKSLVITKERLKEINSTTGFNDKSVRLMALEHSTSQSLAEDRLSKAKLTPIKHYEDAILALRAGEADALVADLAICELAVIRDSTHRLTTLQKPLAVEEISIAINNDEPLLEKRLTEELRALTQSGEINDLRDKWFNSPGWLELLP